MTERHIPDPGRRHLLGALAAAGLLGALPGTARRAQAAGTATADWLLSAWGDSSGRHWAGGQRGADDTLRGVELPYRGHGLAFHPRHPGQLIACARRPGQRLARIDLVAGRVACFIDTEDGRHGGGHAAFSAAGDLLYSGETDADRGRGVIVVRDPLTLAPRAEWDAHGVEPHELCVLADGSLIVANGGLQLDPATGRRVLNRGATDSSLVRLDGRDGRLLDRWQLADREQSLRHLTVGADGTLWIGLQHQSADNDVAVLARLERSGRLSECATPAAVQSTLAAYCASLAADPRSGQLAISCTRGDRVLLFAADGRWLSAHALASASGVCFSAGHFIASGERGDLLLLDPQRPDAASRIATGTRWDNHLYAAPLT
ncbi:DUF1513 domain-containing protein [Plasticicumulans acidivorans]|uniref:DUF1513 domain-containing protein n=1 Tax=Plasticicumulans acidivorans TaxID=886464 RepID=A0A317MWD9_9GAMM|nr:DUF1513 domain-containing protein [Plasticicumulans acidivorans]PWV63216.1 hypothetical protein C7443_103141 [Plasticicumulans acidivorans]